MDITTEYIAMCDCEEVQRQWDMGQEANYFAWRTVDGKFPVYIDRRPGGAEKSSVWLPRQDQIQEMLGIGGLDTNWVFFLRFYVDKNWVLSEYGLKFKTHEQLWLAFYMQDKHGKVWDGKKWKA